MVKPTDKQELAKCKLVNIPGQFHGDRMDKVWLGCVKEALRGTRGRVGRD